MQRTVSPWVALIVVLICIVAVLVIYKFTVGSKVSRQAPPSGELMPIPDESLLEGTPTTEGPGASHAKPVGDEDVETRPAEEKKPLPPAEGTE